MSESIPISPEQIYLEQLRTSRNSSAVLKARLITLRSDMPHVLVFAFEGDDDKIVYSQWVRRLRPELRYEPFPCNGKQGVRNLRNTVHCDLGDLDKNIFFFIDRDFDGTIGFESVEAVFVTEMYSVENYLVDEHVLEDLLKNEFPCHSRPEIRTLIIKRFSNDYETFLNVTAPVNQRLYTIRKALIPLRKPLPTSLRDLAIVQVGGIAGTPTPPEELVVCEYEPTPDQVAACELTFQSLQPRCHYRGKFAMKFFHAWLHGLAGEFKSEEESIFGTKLPKGSIRSAEFVLSNFATKSSLPLGLDTFLGNISQLC